MTTGVYCIRNKLNGKVYVACNKSKKSYRGYVWEYVDRVNYEY